MGRTPLAVTVLVLAAVSAVAQATWKWEPAASAQSNKQPAAETTALDKPIQAKTAQNAAQQHDPESPPKRVVVERVRIAKDRWDYYYIAATLGIAVVTLALAVFAGIQARTARKTLLATFRPKIVVRRIQMRRGTQIPTMGIPDDPWKVVFDIANSGQSRAKITDYNFMIDRLKDEPRTFNIDEKPQPPFTLEPGQVREKAIEIGQELTMILRHIGQSGLAQGWQDTDRLYFWGYVRYTDGRKIANRIGICRRYENKIGRFKPIDDPDYEYADGGLATRH